MGKHKKTLQLIEAAYEILSVHHPMTVRQVHYRLVSSHVYYQQPLQPTEAKNGDHA